MIPAQASTLALTGGTAATTPTEPRALNDVMAQLRSIGTNDPAIQAKLMEDMQRTDPSLWPLLIQTYRSSLAYQDQTRVASMTAPGAVPPPATSAPGTNVPPEIRDGRGCRASRNGQPAPGVDGKSPWTALAVPAAGVADQVVLAAAAPQPVPPPRPMPPAAPVPQPAPVPRACDSRTDRGRQARRSSCSGSSWHRSTRNSSSRTERTSAIACDRGNSHCLGGCSCRGIARCQCATGRVHRARGGVPTQPRPPTSPRRSRPWKNRRRLPCAMPRMYRAGEPADVVSLSGPA